MGFTTIVLACALTLSAAQDSPPTTPPPPEPQAVPGTRLEGERASGKTCLACGQPVDEAHDGIVLQYRGRWVFLHGDECPQCLEHWIADPDALFRELQARSVLFDEGPGADRPGTHGGWLLFGFYVLAGLVVGGVTGYLAVARGHPPVPWFFMGLFLNVVGLVLLFTRGRGDLSAHPAGVPAGLRKVPTTHEPVPCQACGTTNHPAASACSGCGVSLTPSVSSEALRIQGHE